MRRRAMGVAPMWPYSHLRGLQEFSWVLVLKLSGVFGLIRFWVCQIVSAIL